MLNKNVLLSLLCLLMMATSCDSDDSKKPGSHDKIIYTGLKGWELDQTNTGLAAAGLTEDDLTAFDLGGADAGKGEWISANGYYLYLYGNQTIENRIITYTGYLRAPEGGTILRNCLIRPSNCQEGMAMIGIENGTIENCEIDGSLLGIGNIAHTGITANNSTIKNCMIHDCDAGIMASNTGSLMLIQGNYIFNVLYQPGSDDHLAGCSIWASTGEGIDIINNRIVIDDATSALYTSAAFFSQTLNGDISNVRIEGNLLISASYVTRLTESAHITSLPFEFVNNRMLNISDYGTGHGYYAGSVGLTITPSWSDNCEYDPESEDARGDAIEIL